MGPDLGVTRLSVTPVKGLELHHPESIVLTPGGAVGDRLFYLVDDRGRIQSATANPGLYGLRAEYDSGRRQLEITRGSEVLHKGTVEAAGAADTDMWGLRTITSDVVADPGWSDFFSEMVGKRVRLLQARGPAYDVEPATLLGTASVEELARRAGISGIDHPAA
jgi:uncharacterized protein YcbX